MATTKEDSNTKWTHEHKMLLVNCRLAMESEFSGKRKKRIVLWGQVLEKMREADANLPFSRDDLTRKFLNMMTTYKRIKKRNNTSGEAATTWDFFEQFDEVYGSRRDIVVPESELESSLSSLFVDLTNENSNVTENVSPDPRPPPRKRARGDVLEYLRAESESDKKFLSEVLNCEKEKISLEREKLEEIKKLRQTLEAMNN